MIIIFVGPPFAGKGTQAELLSKKLNIKVLSMGAIIREESEKGNPKAIEGIENYSMKGLHVPISLKFDLLKNRMIESNNNFILDNFPATKEDLDTFMKYVEENNLSVTRVLLFQISEDEMFRRMIGRDRIDDNPEILKKRYKVQGEDRQPVVDYFREKKLLEIINGEQSIEMVYNQIVNTLQ